MTKDCGRDRTGSEAPLEGRSLKDPHMLLYRAYHAQQNFLRPRMACIGLGPGQPKLLGLLAARGTATHREIAEYFEIDAAAVSRMLDSLRRNGFVTTEQGKDRRTKVCKLTAKGHEALRAWDESCDAERDAMLEGFSDAEAQQFMAYLDRAHKNLVRANQGAGTPAQPDSAWEDAAGRVASESYEIQRKEGDQQ